MDVELKRLTVTLKELNERITRLEGFFGVELHELTKGLSAQESHDVAAAISIKQLITAGVFYEHIMKYEMLDSETIRKIVAEAVDAIDREPSKQIGVVNLKGKAKEEVN